MSNERHDKVCLRKQNWLNNGVYLELEQTHDVALALQTGDEITYIYDILYCPFCGKRLDNVI